MTPGGKLVFHTSPHFFPDPPPPRKKQSNRRRRKASTPPPPPPPADEGSPLFEPDVTRLSPSVNPAKPGHGQVDDSAHPRQRDHARSDHFLEELLSLPPEHLSHLPAYTAYDIASGHSPAGSSFYQATNFHDDIRPGSSASQHIDRNRNSPEKIVITSSPPPQSPLKRYTYRDIKGVLREIWQPGDPDGLRNGEFPDAASFVERLRFLQHDIGTILKDRNPVPKYVVLDDRACYDIWSSGQYSAKERAKYWHHDFSSNGNVRHGRANRGRPALVPIANGGELVDKKDACGPREVGWGISGDKKKGKKYYFTGERNGYQEVQFAIPDILPTPEPEQESPAKLNVEAATTEKNNEVSKNATGKRRATLTSPVQADHFGTHAIKRQRREETTAPSSPTKRTRSKHSRHISSGSRSDSGHNRDTRPEQHTNKAFLDDSSSVSPPPEQPNQGARTVYAGMTYNYHDDSNFPARVGMGGSTTYSRSAAVSLDPTFVEEAAEEGCQPGSLSANTPVWIHVRDMETEYRATCKKLRSRDEEIKELRAEITRLREMCVERMVRDGKEEQELIDLVSEDGEDRRVKIKAELIERSIMDVADIGAAGDQGCDFGEENNDTTDDLEAIQNGTFELNNGPNDHNSYSGETENVDVAIAEDGMGESSFVVQRSTGPSEDFALMFNSES